MASIMSDEESFVVLGSSPTSSLESLTTINKDIQTTENSLKTQNTVLNSSIQENKINISSNSDEAFSLLTTSSTTETAKPTTASISQTENANNISVVLNNDNDMSLLSIPNENNNKEIYMEDLYLDATNEQNSSESGKQSKNASITSSNDVNTSSNNTVISNTNDPIPFSVMNQQSSSITTNGVIYNDEPNRRNYQLINSKSNGLAASFLLGDVSVDAIKESVLSKFPSLGASEVRDDDIMKIKNYMVHYEELKKSLRESNQQFQQCFSNIQEWKKEMNENIAKLRNENMQLRKELEEKIEIINFVDGELKEENYELRKSVSEKKSLIQNLSAQIAKMDQEQNSFEFIKKNELNDKNQISNNETVPIQAHTNIIKEKERELSQVVAENLQLKDMQKTYIDEINCLKVNLTSAEELLKKAYVDINLLKCKDLEKTELFENYDKDKNEMKQEINLLREQLEVYRKDFEMERNSRQKIAGEKDQLLSDLKMLQKRNQQLIQEAQCRFEREMGRNSNPSTSKESSPQIKNNLNAKLQAEEQIYTPMEYTCPLCDEHFRDLRLIQDHVQGCVDKA